MTCRDWEEILSAWVDGRAEDQERRRLERHLQDCSGCRAQARWLKAMKGSVAALTAPAFPPEAKAALIMEARRAAPQRAAEKTRGRLLAGFWPPRAAGFGAAAAFAAAALVVALRVSDGPETVSVDDMLAAHRQYELTMPLASQEAGLAGLVEALARSRP